MPEIAPRQLAIWLLLAALVLFFGARALNGSKAESVPLAATDREETGQSDSGDFELTGAGEPSGDRIYVHVAGAVRRPGLYRLPEGSRQARAIRRAGGALPRAAIDSINLAAPLIDGQQIFVPRRGEIGTAGISSPASEAAPGGSGSSASSPGASGGSPRIGQAPISLTAATAEQLEQIDGIGPVTAAKILDFRDSQGGVKSIEELDAIPGIGPATMEKLRQALVP